MWNGYHDDSTIMEKQRHAPWNAGANIAAVTVIGTSWPWCCCAGFVLVVVVEAD